MNHYAPHPSAAFEGWYSKFDLPSGAHIALITCSVPNADKHPAHMVSFTYYPKSGRPIFHREHFVSKIHRIQTDSAYAFEIRIPEIGFMRYDADEHSTTTYEFACKEWSLKAKTTGRRAWVPGSPHSTPEGLLVYLPLPLHWHVHSLASPANFNLDIKAIDLPAEDREGKVSIHQEKNWANSFPAAHMWIQAHSPATNESICLAGGKILGMTAYLLGYRSPDLNVSFIPPFALSVLGLSPFMNLDIDWENRAYRLSIAGLWRKIEIKASAPKENGWFGLASPFADGHRANFLQESFRATLEVVVSERESGWWGSWKEVRRSQFEDASLEFGGEYYPERGEAGNAKYELV